MGDAIKIRDRRQRLALIAALLRALGVFSAGVGTAFLFFVSAYPLGLVSAYPAPPASAIEGPLGFAQRVADVDDLYRRTGEPMQPYLERLTTAVARGMVHYWTEGDRWSEADASYTRIGVFDNYLLWMLSFLSEYRENLGNYEFVTPRKALDRGYGFCSQVSKIVYSVLADQGIEATIYSAPEHTVVESNGNILDSDYGVFVPHSLEDVQQDPSIIDTYYAQFGPMLPLLRRAYGQDWQPLGTAEDFNGVRAYEAKFERLKWAPPLAFLAIGILLVTIGILLQYLLLGRGRLVLQRVRGIARSS
ncbi:MULTISPECIES: hypothetical protein [unclassified Mesorhizobium]|uniref:hypothetical protein n=1 Tax=unclassified Mesorhizobium TaxID=325217 RepID=UPI000FCBB4D5|nr:MULTISPECIES: hypothetical protein [unclassified Mesorhizobium]RVD60361.1 hypothetical protein EN746_01325 [Mesorhizobium sp. M8A.F.Ca.ET.023.02.2.1]RWC69004.1 MAG: hypothetical protein EOS30_23455 [Mesorhizobium sp.]RUW56876.1 hypothetical protein EOA36_02010 [Mesorhizobium sp. M8A.F.Ca.ET.021.01.1.1]TGP92562.1 hypothetical protein EN861_18935 [Mesorhizobium sp. M8A.F.Ca.ET.218.01.1.1]TGS42796.1 hypothetical protein EN825_18805 [Mesorhizobium sp. M8A.F.Ca.ET.182.01.1.1]